MDKNFRVRVIVGLAMFIIAVIALYTFNGIPFKVIYGFFSVIAAIELLSFFKKKFTSTQIILAIFEIIFLVCGVIFIAHVSVDDFWYIILGVPGYDIFAYLFGKLFGAKVFKKSRPFRYVSKNKTWEGTILGLLTSILLVAIRLAVMGNFATGWIYLFCGFFALVGDLFESFLKRHFAVKDSNERLIKNPMFEKLEMLVGGSEGHGGFLDRVDSTSFACTLLLIITLITQL